MVDELPSYILDRRIEVTDSTTEHVAGASIEEVRIKIDALDKRIARSFAKAWAFRQTSARKPSMYAVTDVEERFGDIEATVLIVEGPQTRLKEIADSMDI